MELQGLPLHVLVVHAVVVLVPLVALGGTAIALLEWARLRYGSLVAVGAFGAMVATYLAELSGESFRKDERFASPNDAMLAHFAIGESLLVWVILLFVGIVLVQLGQLLVSRNHPRGRLVLYAGMAVTVVCAVASVVQTVRIGHSGAIAVWG